MNDQEAIKRIQKLTRDRGFDPGPIDGVPGPKTALAFGQALLAEPLLVRSLGELLGNING